MKQPYSGLGRAAGPKAPRWQNLGVVWKEGRRPWRGVCAGQRREWSEKLERQTWALSLETFKTFFSPAAGTQARRGQPLTLLALLG